jgi:3-phenylpropionate/cinnamic acid dioxygenase small subunit
MDEEELVQQVISQGARAARLMDDNDFNGLISDMMEAYWNEWLASKTVEEREKLHASAMAVQDMVSVLMGRVSRAQTHQMAIEDDLDHPSADEEC